MEKDTLKLYTVYLHRFPNKKVYIGITCRPVQERWHKDGSGYKNNSLMWKAIKKYGWDNIEHLILYTDVPEIDANNLELTLIQKYKSTDPMFGYNIREGGACASGWKHTAESRAKMSASQTGKTHGPSPLRGTKRGRIPVYQYSLAGEFIATYNTYFEASQYLGIPEASIADCANDRSKTCYGFTFSKKVLSREQVLEKIKAEPGAHRVEFYQYDKFGNLIAKYRSYKAAIDATGFPETSIGSCLKGHNRTCHGFVFSFELQTAEQIAMHYIQKRGKESKYVFVKKDKTTGEATVYYNVYDLADSLNTNTTTIYNILNNKTAKSKIQKKFEIYKELKDES